MLKGKTKIYATVYAFDPISGKKSGDVRSTTHAGSVIRIYRNRETTDMKERELYPPGDEIRFYGEEAFAGFQLEISQLTPFGRVPEEKKLNLLQELEAIVDRTINSTFIESSVDRERRIKIEQEMKGRVQFSILKNSQYERLSIEFGEDSTDFRVLDITKEIASGKIIELKDTQQQDYLSGPGKVKVRTLSIITFKPE